MVCAASYPWNTVSVTSQSVMLQKVTGWAKLQDPIFASFFAQARKTSGLSALQETSPAKCSRGGQRLQDRQTATFAHRWGLLPAWRKTMKASGPASIWHASPSVHSASPNFADCYWSESPISNICLRLSPHLVSYSKSFPLFWSESQLFPKFWQLCIQNVLGKQHTILDQVL